MDCHLCEVRSSVGYCVECQGLLCETCGVPCENCGKISCPEHIHETRSGRNLCKSCYDERREKRKEMKAAAQRKSEGDSSLAALEGQEEGEIGDEALTLSARQPVKPWQLSLYIAGGGLLFVLLMLVLPALRRIPLGGDNYIPTTYVVLIFPILAIVWSLIGLIKEDYFEDRPKCFIGIGVAVLGAVLAFVAMWTDPAAKMESQVQTLQNERQDMTPEQLKQWRENALKQYNQ